MNEWMDGWMGGWTNEQKDGWMDGRTNGWMDGWILYERFGQTRCDLLTTFVSAVARKSL